MAIATKRIQPHTRAMRYAIVFAARTIPTLVRAREQRVPSRLRAVMSRATEVEEMAIPRDIRVAMTTNIFLGQAKDRRRKEPRNRHRKVAPRKQEVPMNTTMTIIAAKAMSAVKSLTINAMIPGPARKEVRAALAITFGEYMT